MFHRIFFSLVFICSLALSTSQALADLNVFLGGLNDQARVDRLDYGQRLSAQFNVPMSEVELILSEVQFPGDAFMCFQLGSMLHLPPERVLQTYKTNKGGGWGVTAQQLGIKPGSPEFHALKDGRYSLERLPKGLYGKPEYSDGKKGSHSKKSQHDQKKGPAKEQSKKEHKNGANKGQGKKNGSKEHGQGQLKEKGNKK